MKKIKEYQTVSSSDEERFTKRVNEAIKNGWQPYGSMVVYQTEGGFVHFVQPMVK